MLMTAPAADPKLQTVAPWERQEDESDAAWQAFAIYRDLGLQRTYAATAAKCRKHVSLVQRWSLVRNWKHRTKAWDRELDRTRIDAHKQALREMESRHSHVAATMIGRLGERLGQLTKEDLAQMAPRDLALWFKLSVEIERRSRGADLFLKPQSTHHALDDDDDAWVLQNFDINELRLTTKE
jgi:hypothetical protein